MVFSTRLDWKQDLSCTTRARLQRSRPRCAVQAALAAARRIWHNAPSSTWPLVSGLVARSVRVYRPFCSWEPTVAIPNVGFGPEGFPAPPPVRAAPASMGRHPQPSIGADVGVPRKPTLPGKDGEKEKCAPPRSPGAGRGSQAWLEVPRVKPTRRHERLVT